MTGVTVAFMWRTPAVAAFVLSTSLLVTGPAQAADPVGEGLQVDPRAATLPTLSAASFLVADLDSGDVLAARDAHGQYAPASTLKALTAVALLPHLTPGQRVTPTFDDVNADGSKVGLDDSLSYPVSDLVRAMLMVSGNDAAGAVATAVGGPATAMTLINAEARRLGAVDTVAKNPSGLDAEGQLSTAYDLALIARAGLSMPTFRADVATQTSSVPAPGGASIETYNHNKLLRNYDGALGVKNGYTVAARASFIGAAERDGRTLVVTLMRADPKVWAEAGQLLDWGFDALASGVRPVGSLGEAVAPVPRADPAATTPVAVVTPAPTEPAGRTPVLLTTAGVLAGGLVFRRRQVVVKQRNRRRRAAGMSVAAAGRGS